MTLSQRHKFLSLQQICIEFGVRQFCAKEFVRQLEDTSTYFGYEIEIGLAEVWKRTRVVG